jgi:MHS family alpha-ketoglutarate permease-like MFS transporter
MSESTSEVPTETKQREKAIVGGSVGNLVEWYDWYCYSACAIYFSPHFFPYSDPTAQLLNTAGIFAVGFFYATNRRMDIWQYCR